MGVRITLDNYWIFNCYQSIDQTQNSYGQASVSRVNEQPITVFT
jgi:hypothetical protein